MEILKGVTKIALAVAIVVVARKIGYQNNSVASDMLKFMPLHKRKI
jgi:hypothetical protein